MIANKSIIFEGSIREAYSRSKSFRHLHVPRFRPFPRTRVSLGTIDIVARARRDVLGEEADYGIDDSLLGDTNAQKGRRPEIRWFASIFLSVNVSSMPTALLFAEFSRSDCSPRFQFYQCLWRFCRKGRGAACCLKKEVVLLYRWIEIRKGNKDGVRWM